MQRTYIFTVGKAITYNVEKSAVEEKDFRFTYSSLYNTPEKILKQAEKALKTRIIAVKDVKHIAELRVLDDDKFYTLSTCEKTSDYIPDEKGDK